ncbi:phage terminase small subunit [Enterobacter hormaechei]|uniref:phage terminase small subunit n=1 Tax=Enterobacter hormaechei TaxID=158836 RepID=UPI0007506D8C|nr:phage terminase small subunit [Enterobacter hormaechei]KUR19419.1 terminase [Enterobacter hormaechei subsp. steigerwaltii]MCM7542922.1 phage terminase small subunit [Enterobacter hormaechei]MCM7584593.1 phage terminase small subunit [Enterobacter hormaechei]MDK7606208.1 phage terminase small subunit [Enterobacter hormaechei]MDX7045307.1 phage terminase small subunit [Enterobacter hormaechei]
MLTPAQKHFQRVMAERRGQADEESDIQRTAHEQILHRLRMDLSRLSGVQSEETKAEMKKSMLPEYEGWIEGTLDGDSGRQDEVITRLMVWAIDCRDYALALRLGRYVVRHGLTLPDNFNRTAATFLTEEMSKPVLTLAAADADADLSASTAVLDEVAEIVADSDMPDVVRAKLCKARALARRGATDITTKAEALALFREALTRNPNAGVKKEIATLAREVKKLSADGGTGEGGAASTDKTDGTVEPVPEKTTTASAAGKAATRKTTTKTATGKATKRKPVSQKKN